MRSREEIEKEKTYWKDDIAINSKLILEVLLDIRDGIYY